MEPPPGPARSSRRAAGAVLVLLSVLPLAACVPDAVVPAAPASTQPPASTPSTTPSATPTDSPSDESGTRPLPSGVGTDASGQYTYAKPVEPPCALPDGAPTSVPGATGPQLTLQRVKAAWKASELGHSWGVTAGKLKAGGTSPGVQPGSVLAVVGTEYAAVTFFEWYGLRTWVLDDPGEAAARLEAVRLVVREPCSYPYSPFEGPSIVVHLGEDRRDVVTVSGVVADNPVTDVFIRYGNTVTEFSAMVRTLSTDEALTTVMDALTKA